MLSIPSAPYEVFDTGWCKEEALGRLYFHVEGFRKHWEGSRDISKVPLSF